MSVGCGHFWDICSPKWDSRIYAMDGCGYGIVLLEKEAYNSSIGTGMGGNRI